MRGVAALLVVFYHIESHFDGSLWQMLYDRIFSRGHIGVDLFFVLSGFLMTYLRPRQTGCKVAGRFLIRRLLRIWPSYVVVTLLYAATAYYSSVQQIVLSLLFLPQSADPPLVLGFPTVFVGWTLNYEAYFYLLCGVSLLFAGNRYFPWLLLAWTLVTLVLVPLVHDQNLLVPPLEVPPGNYPFLYLALVTNPIIWEFVIGAMVAVVITRCQARITALSVRAARGIALGGVAVFVVFFLALDNKMEPLACGLPSAALVAGLVIADLRGAWSISPWLERFGDASYCTYLLHPLWIFHFSSLLRMSAVVEVLAVIAIVALTLTSASVMHRFFEKPLLGSARRFLSRKAASGYIQ